MSTTANEVISRNGKKVKQLPPQTFLEECFDYSPETGELRWKTRPQSHFKSQKGWSAFNSRLASKTIACPHSQGYRLVRLTFEGVEDLFFIHRIIFAILGIDLPDGKMVDHINGIRSDNRLCNLRVADMHQNACNSLLTGGKKPKNGHLPRGVCPSSSFGKFTSRIRHRGKVIGLGVFLTPEEARAAYVAKAIELRGEFVSID